MKFSSKVLKCGLSPMRKFHPYAVAAEAKGRKIYHLNIGQPDIETPKAYFDAVKHFDLPVLAYAPSPGIPELIEAIRAGTTVSFREKYRKADALLIDDIQFIAGKESTQEEFFHTFNNLYENHHQIVLTADRPPNEMLRLEDRLKTRFEWGLMVDVAPPDFETRFAIVQNKAAMLGVKLPNEVTDYIAENITSNVRQIEGTLNKILAYRDLLDDQVNEETVSRAIRDMLKKSNDFAPTPSIIVGYICSYFHVDEETLRGQSRSRDVVAARQIAMYLIRRMTSMSLNDIGKEFGDRDHSTILHSLDKVESTMRSDPAFAEKVKEITTNINSKK